jgi:secondary thiamine-phosphate synthase enzyme
VTARAPRPIPGLALAQTTLAAATRPRSFTDVTADMARWLASVGAEAGTLSVLVRHTSASLVIQENTDPDVRHDLADLLDDLAPETRRWRHGLEGPDDMPAHAKAMLTSPSLTIPVSGGRMQLGTWQAIYLAEYRATPHTRELALSFIGTFAAA